MTRGKIAVISAFIVLICALTGVSLALGRVYSKVRAFEREHGGDVFANLSREQLDEKAKDEIKKTPVAVLTASDSPEPAKPSEPVQAAAPETLQIRRFDQEGDSVRLWFDDVPDVSVARNYISVSPLREGTFSVACQNRYDYSSGRNFPTLVVSGDFAYRTNVTLTVRKGFSAKKGDDGKAPVEPLAEDYVKVFTRPDASSSVEFSDQGRYLPPTGDRTVALETVNVTNLGVRIRRVLPRNLVTFLALEERTLNRVYRRWDDSEDFAEDFSDEGETNLVVVAEAPNEKTPVMLPVGLQDGGPANGVYLVKAFDTARSNGDDRQWSNEEAIAARVVCVSDLALSVRDLGNDRLGVWTTSLVTGSPVPRAVVEVYSQTGVKLMEGVADDRGWCALERQAKGEPFAVVAYREDAADFTFLALRDSMKVDETRLDGVRARYLAPGETEAFVWSDRGIYRHGEPIRVQAVLRDGGRRAPAARPVELTLADPRGTVRQRQTRITDREGAVTADDFTVPDELPSGRWTLSAKIPGENGAVLGSRTIKIEEFAPPRIRVSVRPYPLATPSDFTFTVAAEHLSGGPAVRMRTEGAVSFEDVPFAPEGWKGWTFGNEDLSLTPNFRRLSESRLDDDGEHVFIAPLLAESGHPRAAVKVTAEGTVFEDGGRPATARSTAVLHAYPFYIGSTLGNWVKRPENGRVKLSLACVAQDGSRLKEAKDLVMKIESVMDVHAYHAGRRNWGSWSTERIRTKVADDLKVSVPADAVAEVELPVLASGDYVMTVTDLATGVSFGRSFYLCDWGDDAEVRTSLGNPSKVTLTTDKAAYRVGETPRLLVRAPFAGTALLTVLRDSERYIEVVTLTNATSELALRPVSAADAPNLEVRLSVVQGVEANARHLAVRAHGEATVTVRPVEDEILVAIEAELARDLGSLDVSVSAPGASAVVVTVVDEGINLFTDEPVPDPVGCFARLRLAYLPFYDLYHRVLPVYGLDALRKSGVKTGGGADDGMFGRVSPVPTRRFRPLALWSGRLETVDGVARTRFALPVFTGELRITAVALSDRASGAGAVRRKVAPKLVAEPDAPRFVAPGDVFEATLPVRNTSETDGHFMALILTNGVTVGVWKDVQIARGGQTNLVLELVAPADPGELTLKYAVRGMNELHEEEIFLPVRPAVAWRETAGVTKLAPGETYRPDGKRVTYKVYDSPLAELQGAVTWLSEYPYGCLEQTTSRCFPLIAAGGILSELKSDDASNTVACAVAGVRRVESMVRSHDFVMWPDCNYAPWDPEVSLYAAHFLVEAGKAGLALNPKADANVKRFLSRWALSTNDTVSAYACHTLALAGKPERDRMLRLYDGRDRLSLLSRARLSRAFVRVGDRPRAEALLANAERPGSIKEAAFTMLALLDLDPDDPRILPLVTYLVDGRDRTRYSWGTTDTNAHALLALGAYYRAHPPKKGERYVAWRKLTLPRPEEVKDEAEGFSIRREIMTTDGKPAALSELRQGDLLTVRLTLRSADKREFSDLVIEDLLPGCFEPVSQSAFAPSSCLRDWVMRSDARDDRMLVFSKRFELEKDEEVAFRYQVRVVSTGVFTLPGVAAEGMYHPQLRARTGAGRVVVRH